MLIYEWHKIHKYFKSYIVSAFLSSMVYNYCYYEYGILYQN